MPTSPTIEDQAAKFEARSVSDRVYQLFPDPKDPASRDYNVELVFFHGLQMEGSAPEHSFWRTWKRRHSEECWPETLLPELLLELIPSKETTIRPRVLSVSYEGRPDLTEDKVGTESSDEYLIAESLIHELIYSGGADVGQKKGVPVILVGHDLGGILIKVFVLQVESQGAMMRDEDNRARIHKFLENLTSVFFFATPHVGSNAIERISANINEDANQMLCLMKVLNNKMSRINDEFQCYRRGETTYKKSRFTSYAVHALHETNEGGFTNELVVPESSAREYVDIFYSADANHFSVCQMEAKQSSPLQILCQVIETEVVT